MKTVKEKEKTASAETSKTPAKDRKRLIIPIAVLIVMAAAILIVVLVSRPASDKATATPDETAATQPQAQIPSYVKMVEDEDTYLIDLGFVTLRYPLEYKDQVQISGVEKHAATDAFTLCFSVGDVKLFDYIFNREEGDFLGTLPTEGGNALVYIRTYALDTDDYELMLKQESLNVIIQGMISDYGFLTGETIIEPNDEVSDIPTDLVTLSYPERWKDKVEIKVEGKKVSFANGDTPLFDLCFEECDGYLLGTYDGTPIYIIEYPVETEEQIAMQQDVNVIIDHLCQDAKFVINA